MAITSSIVYSSGKEKQYRGKSIEELQKLDTREFAKLLKSRPRRMLMRNFNVIEDFVKRCQKKVAKGKQIRTQKRDIVIVPALIGMTISIHNGKEFLQLKVTEEMLGHRLGEFAMTRRFTKHGSAGIGATKGSKSLSVK
jgi:small subunit ribosomal protein S19